MNWHDKRIKYLAIFIIIITALVCFRIVTNIMSARAKAEKAAEGHTTPVTTGFPKRENIKPVIKLSGNLDPIWQADIGAKVAGHLEDVRVKVGDAVVAGQVLAVLDSGELAATANSAEGSVFDARASLSSAETTLARYRKLYESGAISKAELDNAQFTRDMAQGKLNAAEGTYRNALSRVQGTEVITPEKGTVVKRYYQEGFYAAAGTVLFNVADTTSLVVKINIPEGQIGAVELGTKTDIIIPAMDNKKVTGTITKLAQVADTPGRTFAAEVTVDNSDNSLRGGLFANVLVDTKEKTNVLTIPEQAIVMREDQRTVYVADKEGKISRKVLDTGFIGDGIVEVLGGLEETDEIVLTGQNKIREGSIISRAKDGE